MKASDLVRKYLDFFVKNNHQIIPSASLVPENDPTVLFTTAGMQPLTPYLLGETHPLGKRLVSVQRCLRTDDIEEVGDAFHHTFFEMLGNWSLGGPARNASHSDAGGYFKRESISLSYEFLTKELNLDINKIYITVFEGDKDAPRDEESAEQWQSLGIPKERIFYFPKEDNWWGPAGATGPCGPDTEMHYDTGKKPCSPDCRPGCPNNCGKFVEIWNNVFMQYFKNADGAFTPLKQKNVDTGMGLERTLAVLSNTDDNYQTELFSSIIQAIKQVKKQKYTDDTKAFRIIADHLKTAVFLIGDGVLPSNTERGYVLRRLIRRSLVKGKLLDFDNYPLSPILDSIKNTYHDRYPNLNTDFGKITQTIQTEWLKFKNSLKAGLPILQKSLPQFINVLPGDKAFLFYESYGLPLAIIEEEAEKVGLKIDKEGYQKALEKHQTASRMGASQKFSGGLADHSVETTKLHTATHLLHQALRLTLGTHVSQKGSNITSERLRFDFSHPQKLTPVELQKVENLVNEKITENLPVSFKIMTLEDAQKEGALAFFRELYADKIKVYSMGDFSKEVCGGPHVSFTGELKSFKIIKEESAGSGLRRLYAKVE